MLIGNQDKIDVKATLYSGTYGSVHEHGTIVHVKLTSTNTTEINGKNKEVIFVLDVSSSMTNQMTYMINSLRSFRDAIIGKSAEEIGKLSDMRRDELFRKSLNVKIIPFSNDVIESSIWISESTERTFEETLLNLNTQSMTNMSAGVVRALEMTNPNRITWIIIMTDGESNIGKHRTVESFQMLATSKCLNSKIITLGYGQQFNPEVLNKLGEFIYMDTADKIPLVFGNIAVEVMTSWAINCNIDIRGATELHDDTIIPSLHETYMSNIQILVGERVIGTLYDGRDYNLIYLISGNLGNEEIVIKYKCISNNEVVTINPRIEDKRYDTIPDNICKYYFNAEKGRLMYKLYCAIRENNTNRVSNEVRHIIHGWTNLISYDAKNEILSIIESISKLSDNNYSYSKQHQTMSMLFNVVGTVRQYDYMSFNSNSPIHMLYVNGSIQSANYYSKLDLNDK
jgi:hypothetical protein